jgi:hypothetical protein
MGILLFVSSLKSEVNVMCSVPNLFPLDDRFSEDGMFDNVDSLGSTLNLVDECPFPTEESEPEVRYLSMHLSCFRCDGPCSPEAESTAYLHEGIQRLFYCPKCSAELTQCDQRQLDLILTHYFAIGNMTVVEIEKFMHSKGIPYSKMDTKFILTALGFSKGR